MGTQRSSFAKRERDRAKKAKAAAKRESRLEKPSDEDLEDEEETTTATGPQESAEALMDKLAKLHERFDDGGMDFDDFEEQKAELMARMPIE